MLIVLTCAEACSPPLSPWPSPASIAGSATTTGVSCSPSGALTSISWWKRFKQLLWQKSACGNIHVHNPTKMNQAMNASGMGWGWVGTIFTRTAATMAKFERKLTRSLL